ncbi:MAG TPA: alpha/beta hydrolase [Dehalococcoidia bacterium]|nr:alpha/beta hydrolase [Dehalococcoidia bacterium]
MAYFNTFAQGLEPLEMTHTDEFASLVASAHDLGLPVPEAVRYRSRNTVVNGLRFHLLEWGDPSAPAILLLHGGNQTAHSWDLVSLALCDRYHVIAIDQRGHGDSEWPRDGQADRHARADDARQILAALGIERPIVCGHSMGGIVAMTLLVAHPELAQQAVIVDVGPELGAEGAKYIGNFISSVHEVASLEEFVDRVAAYDPFRTRAHIDRTARYNLMQRADGKFVSKHDHRERLEWRSRQATAVELDDPAPPTASAERLAARIDRPSYDDVATIPCPVLVVRGAQSNVLLPEMAERFVRTLPHGRLVEVPRCGHNVHSQNTAGFLAAVEPFLQEAGAGTSQPG